MQSNMHYKWFDNIQERGYVQLVQPAKPIGNIDVDNDAFIAGVCWK